MFCKTKQISNGKSQISVNIVRSPRPLRVFWPNAPDLRRARRALGVQGPWPRKRLVFGKREMMLMKCNWATSWFGNGVGARCQVFCCITHVLSTEYTDPCSTFLYKVCRTTWVWCRAVLSCLVRSRLGGKALIRPKPTLIRWLFNALAQLQNIQERLRDKTNYVGMLWIHTADERKLEFEMVRVQAPYCSNHSNLLSSSSSWAFIFFDPLPGWPRGAAIAIEG